MFLALFTFQASAQQASAIVFRPPLSPIRNVQVTLQRAVINNPTTSIETTTSSGNATFKPTTLAQYGGVGNYRVFARAKDSTRNGYLNGVTTYDLTLISRHILGILTLSPFQQMCADANGNEIVSTADLTLARKLILGITNNLGDDPIGVTRPSWLFWSENATSLNSLNSLQTNVINGPFGAGFFLKQNVTSLANLSNIPIVAGKLGDVNSSSAPAALVENTSSLFKNIASTSRTSKAFDSDLNLKNGEEVKINVSLFDNQNTIAWQWGAKFDANSLDIVKVEGVDADNFYHNKEANTITALNFVSEGHFSDSKCLSITLKAKKDIATLANLIEFDNELIENVGYDSNQNADNNAFDYEVTKKTSNTVNISPNPFKESLNLSLPSFEGEAQVSMFDVTGRTVLSKTTTGSQVTFDSDLNNLSNGVYFINITLPNGDKVQQKLLKQ